MPRPNPNILLVEGDDEKRVIPYIMDEHVVWGDKPDDWAAEIRSQGGIDDLLDPSNIETEARVPGRKALGIVVDADDQFDSRWQSVRNCCLAIAADFPEELPPDGLVHQSAHGLRIGVWIMPDNQSRGMLETFLRHLVVPSHAALWAFAQESCTQSRDHGAPYTDPHRDKADIHTFLAWLDPPGRSLHVSVLARALDARLPLGERFARWFIDLYQLAPRPTPLP
jgi:hypothetical protein